MPEPVYEDIQMTRHLGHPLTVDTAPPYTKIALFVLLQRGVYLETRTDMPDHIQIADQVVYRVHGWDPDSACLLLELVEDWRPKATGATDAHA